MAVGQVGFKDPRMVQDFSMVPGRVAFADPLWLRQVKKILVPTRQNPIINRLNKTKIEKFPDLNMEKVEILQARSKKNQAAMLARVKFSRPSHVRTSVLTFYVEERRGSNSEGEERDEVSEGACVWRYLYRRKSRAVEQSEPQWGLFGWFHVGKRQNWDPSASARLPYVYKAFSVIQRVFKHRSCMYGLRSVYGLKLGEEQLDVLTACTPSTASKIPISRHNLYASSKNLSIAFRLC
jgi:hypothetical protein